MSRRRARALSLACAHGSTAGEAPRKKHSHQIRRARIGVRIYCVYRDVPHRNADG